MESLLQVSDLRIRYETKVAVDGISFTVNPGEIIGLLGPNGAGKSSTIRAICGIVPPTSGSIITCGVNAAEAPFEVKRRVGYVAEDAALIDVFTPLEYFRFLGDLRELEAGLVKERGLALLAELRLEEDALNKRMGGFSKGMKQKVAIAAALLHDPHLVLLDEPLNGLDVESTGRFKELLATFAKRGGAIVYCSHLVDVMERFVPRVLIVQQGKLKADIAMAELIQQDGSLEAAFTRVTTEAEA